MTKRLSRSFHISPEAASGALLNTARRQEVHALDEYFLGNFLLDLRQSDMVVRYAQWQAQGNVPLCRAEMRVSQ
ncbi:hypothetical protein [Variovorax paradoxus]|uniref:hypothetical protein n=1 Tax=Variovorax paradoxus TaxID=34073 RepID=UPI0005A5132B|nr:hypothetical protein [Variovorax paradoxus]